MGQVADLVGVLLGCALASGFRVQVGDGGAVEVQSGNATRIILSSSFSEPGPVFHNLSTSPLPGGGSWAVEVDRVNVSRGMWTVRASAPSFSLRRF